MSYKLPMSTISPSEKRNDLHLTSSGVGHAFRQTAQFPPENFKTIRLQPLPVYLNIAPHTTIDDIYQTTTSTTHDYKESETTYNHPQYKKSPSLLKVNYTLDTINKLNSKPCRCLLTMGNQKSEMQDKYTAKPDKITQLLTQSPDSIVDVTLSDHHKEGPTKGLKPTTTNQALKGKPFIPQNQAILHRNEPYMTTNNWYHRTFSREELSCYPKKDIATYWQCEDYPKAWGFGTKENPLPKRRHQTDPGPMRDRMVFRTGTTIPRLPKTMQPVSNGLKSQYSTSYSNPPNDKRQNLFSKLVEPAFSKTEKDMSLLQTVPHMYKSVNMSYGNGAVQIANS